MKSQYLKFRDIWMTRPNKEKFFVSYAVEGPMDPRVGTRASLPIDYPLLQGIGRYTVEPSPLNNRYIFQLPEPSLMAIL